MDLELWCAGCGGVRAFEVPLCDDGHGGDCPDRACVVCGAAVVVGLFPVGSSAALLAVATSAA